MDNPVVVMTCTFAHEAQMIKGYLESKCIETYFKDEMPEQVNPACSNDVGGIKIVVGAPDYDKTIKLLRKAGYIS